MILLLFLLLRCLLLVVVVVVGGRCRCRVESLFDVFFCVVVALCMRKPAILPACLYA